MKHTACTLGALTLLAVGPALAPAPAIAADDVTIAEPNVIRVLPYETIPVGRIPDDVYLRSTNDPDDVIWERLPEYRVHVAPAPVVHESVGLRINYADEGQALYFTPARTSDRFYVRLRWRDDTHDTVTLRDRFRDGVAVQFSLGDDTTSYIMGNGPDEPVNIWYWRADTDAFENLAAGGARSLTRLEEQPVTGESQYVENSDDPNEWTVVLSRPLEPNGPHQVTFDTGGSVPVAFAVWQGSDAERDGLKNVSTGWILLDLGAD
ncbi:ethylbenzene dehydrogenase-related protein [Rhodospira trueperi]|uniref:Dimethylsulfide dehydrogenase subunit gamma/complex iron-sulfur molybdoenzyme family reductase subunit gamma n=1 Tax=Rhodospira trueperi TaxID=69960 RepID=A0A1G7D8B6_9PROT|nr:ethylbenzene dehydrogenase-related protein [Rhodospira trueperi]SDE47763.1 dimethylsulfide dehydrogenase subunit gamma/complex iron-sulfur molybdoenzyme family reductase subunit gamma [Rhodospira trueperi]